MNYSWKDVPPILSHLNQQHERFAANFSCKFILLMPSWGINYFVQRAPDFFDWRSVLFHFPSTDDEILKQADKILEQSTQIPEDISEDPETQVKLLIQEGDLLLHSGLHEQALGCFDQAHKVAPKDPSVYFKLALTLLLFGRPDRAENVLEKVVEHSKDDKLLNLYGVILIGLGQTEKALESFTKATRIDPSKSGYWLNHGKTLSQLERYDEASESFSKGLELDPKDANLWKLHNALCTRRVELGSLTPVD